MPTNSMNSVLGKVSTALTKLQTCVYVSEVTLSSSVIAKSKKSSYVIYLMHVWLLTITSLQHLPNQISIEALEISKIHSFVQISSTKR